MSDDASKADRLSLHDLLLAFTALEACARATRPMRARHVRRRENRDLTFDMSGRPKRAKRALVCPLDGGVRRLVHLCAHVEVERLAALLSCNGKS